MSESNMQNTHNPYTPTTEEVRADYCLLADVSRPRQLQFDRWLAEVKEAAWQEGFKRGYGWAHNPYRQDV